MEERKSKLFVCTHGRFGEELIRTAEMIVGEIKDVTPFSLLPGTSPEELKEAVRNELEKSSGESFLCLVDLLGGTPFNVMAELRKEFDITIVTGLNLPMFLEAYGEFSGRPVRETAECAREALKDSGRVIKSIKAEEEDNGC